MLAVAATCLVAALVGAPTAGAASSSGNHAKAQSAVTKKKLARDIASVRRRTNAARRTLRTLGRTIAALQTSLNDVRTKGEGTQGQVNGILAAVPQVLDALTQLRDGSLALKAGLETLATKTTEGFNTVTGVLTQLGNGLTDVGDFLGATEYGFGQVIVLQPAPAGQAGSFIVTPDIPDTVQQAMTHQEFIAQHTGTLAVAYGVRSGENDGDGTTPAAHCRVRVTNGASTGTTAANPGLGGLPFQPVNDKSALTSTAPANAGFPFGLKQDAVGPPADEEDHTTTFVSSVNVAAGDRYEVELSCVDLSPDADDPEA
ncbi:MAG TPA: hypothetical protein VF529_21190 [Solirubrobacteraceae bacterium]|jgi:hypothetical protein